MSKNKKIKPTHTKKTYKRYSVAFKRQLVRQIEAAELTISEARRRYNIGGATTVQRWLRQYGKHDHTTEEQRIIMAEDVDRTRALEEKNQKLESALAEAHLKILTLESTLEVAKDDLGADVKKSIDTLLSERL